MHEARELLGQRKRLQQRWATMDVPIVDISGFQSGSNEARRAIAAELDSAACRIGFMQIVGHGIPASASAGLAAAIDGFFALPTAEKAQSKASSPALNRGYSGARTEHLSHSLGVASAADLFEAFNIGAAASDHPGLALSPAHYPENLWPARPAEFRARIECWFGHAGRLARDLTRVFERALGLPDHYFATFQDHSLDVLRINHYGMPPGVCRVEPDQMGMGAHTDYGIVTVLWADPVVPGLQILTPSGHWQDVTPVPGALLVNLGDLLARWTNDRWRSTLHRVLPPIDASGRAIRRRSAAYFHDGNADAVVDCLPGCSDADHPPLYPPVTIAEHLSAKLAGSRGLQLNDQAGREAARLRAAHLPGGAGSIEVAPAAPTAPTAPITPRVNDCSLAGRSVPESALAPQFRADDGA